MAVRTVCECVKHEKPYRERTGTNSRLLRPPFHSIQQLRCSMVQHLCGELAHQVHMLLSQAGSTTKHTAAGSSGHPPLLYCLLPHTSPVPCNTGCWPATMTPGTVTCKRVSLALGCLGCPFLGCKFEGILRLASTPVRSSCNSNQDGAYDESMSCNPWACTRRTLAACVLQAQPQQDSTTWPAKPLLQLQ